MEIFPTFFAKVFVGRAFLGHDADAGSVLPYLADIALHVETGDIICDIETSKYYGVCVSRLLVFGIERRRTGIVVESADTADGLVILLDVIAAVGHFY